LTASGEADKALATIERLERLGEPAEAALFLLKARALLAAGRTSEARHAFRDFLAHRKIAGDV
jgi:type III secretion protein Y